MGCAAGFANYKWIAKDASCLAPTRRWNGFKTLCSEWCFQWTETSSIMNSLTKDSPFQSKIIPFLSSTKELKKLRRDSTLGNASTRWCKVNKSNWLARSAKASNKTCRWTYGDCRTSWCCILKGSITSPDIWRSLTQLCSFHYTHSTWATGLKMKIERSRMCWGAVLSVRFTTCMLWRTIGDTLGEDTITLIAKWMSRAVRKWLMKGTWNKAKTCWMRRNKSEWNSMMRKWKTWMKRKCKASMDTFCFIRGECSPAVTLSTVLL